MYAITSNLLLGIFQVTYSLPAFLFVERKEKKRKKSKRECRQKNRILPYKSTMYYRTALLENCSISDCIF